jgi:Methyltransferase domain
MRLANDLKTGVASLDSYLSDGFYDVLGMSSRFAASITANLMLFQSENNIEGDFVEIGTFLGRFFISSTLCLKEKEQALGIDTFDWPDQGVKARFEDNCKKWGVTKFTALKTNTSTLKNLLDNGRKARVIHIDGDHSPEPLTHDLNLALDCLHPQGVIVLDDMLHPSYPFLTSVVQKFLEANKDFRLMAVVDRENIVAAAKFMLCHIDCVPLYETFLMKRFKKRHFILGGDALGHHCVVLTLKPMLAKVE